MSEMLNWNFQVVLLFFLRTDYLFKNPLQNRVNQALNTPISTRCAELTVLIDRCSSKDLQTIFPGLIEHIFGTAGSVSWRLRNILSNKTPYEFNTLHHFLGPLGPIFRLIYKLLTDTQVKYEYPVIYLPEKVRQNLENSKVPPFYTDLLNIETQSRKLHSLTLNAFDFYMFHFAYYLVNPYQQYNVSNEWSVWNTVYYVLGCDYMLHFLPTDPNVVILPQLINFTGKNPTIIPPQSVTNRPQCTSKLFRNHVLQQTAADISTLHQPMQQHPRGEIWRSEAVVQIFIDMWLNNNIISTNDTSFNLQYDNKVNRLPNGEYIRIIRVFVKQLHAFANSGRHDTSPLGELKKIVQPMIQGPMYAFIRHLVHRWPTDGSFRLVLELWLSFIQPWRYSGESQFKNHFMAAFKSTYLEQNYNESFEFRDTEMDDPNAPHIKFVDQNSVGFIADNLLAYTVILQQLIPRFSRIDLSSPKISLMVFRVLKVFSQPNLIPMIREVESCVENLNHSPTHSYNNQGTVLPPLSPTTCWSTNTSYSATNMNLSYHSDSPIKSTSSSDSLNFQPSRNNLLTNKWAAIVRHRIYEWEGPEFCYKPMFTRTIAPEVYQLLMQVQSAEQTAKEIVQQRAKENNLQYSNLFASFFKSLFENEDFIYDEFSLEERVRVPTLLSNAKANLIDIFRLEADELPEMSFENSRNRSYNISSSLNNPQNFDLTPNGSRNRAKNIKYQGDPDLHPIRSNENAFLVRILYQFSQKVNQTYALDLRDIYFRNDFIGKLSRQILNGPLITHSYDKSIPGYSPRIQRMLPPRLSLRNFASHSILMYIVLGFLLARFFGFGTISFVFIILISWCIIILFKALIDRKDPNVIDNDYFNDSLHDLSY